MEKKPFIRFEKIRLEGVRKKDTIAIEQAICVYFPIENLIKGTSGTVFWKRTGLDSSVVAVLPSFEINANSAAYSVPEVSFSYPLYFPNQVLKGKFEDKVFVGGASVEGSYPKFESSETVLSIQNIGDPRL